CPGGYWLVARVSAPRFFLRALTAQRVGDEAGWDNVDALMLKVLAAAEKVARYRHAQLSAMRLSGDLNARPENCEPRRAAGEHQGGVDSTFTFAVTQPNPTFQDQHAAA